jgi:WD40 repeat protein
LLRLSHKGTVSAVAFSPDGMRVATGGADNNSRIWDLRNGQQLLPIPHDGAVVAVAFNGDGTRLATAGPDNIARIRIWNTANGKLLLS